VTCHHPLAYLLGTEEVALLRAWADDHDFDKDFVTERPAEVRPGNSLFDLDEPILDSNRAGLALDVVGDSAG
jgi:hypothetical protein